MFVFLISCEVLIRKYLIVIPRSIPNIVSLVYENDNQNIVIGDSQVYRGFILETEFLNLGRRGTPIPSISIILDKYFSKVTPNKVILEASPQFFSKVHLERQTLGYEKYFKLVNSWIQIYLFDPGFTQYIKKIKTLKDIKNILKQKWPDDTSRTSNNWLRLSEEKRSEKTLLRVNHHRPILDDKRAVAYKELYEKIIKKLLNQKANICLLRTPVNKEYLMLANNDENYLKAETFFKQLAMKYKIKYIDFSELGINFKEEMFINQDHITPQASSIFSKKVKEECFKS